MNGEDKGSEPVLKLTKRVENTLYSSLAQSVERMTVNHDVAGSSPAGGAKRKAGQNVDLLFVLIMYEGSKGRSE